MSVRLLAAPDSWPLDQGSAWLILIGSYLLGAIPFGLLIARFIRGVDIREIGSGNIGATNTMRAMGRGWGLVAFALDFLKGLVPVIVTPLLFKGGPADLDALRVLAGVAAVLGHCFPVWLGFRGGKGVATACGAIFAIDPITVLVGLAIWLVTLGSTRFVGLASVLMIASYPVTLWVRTGGRSGVMLAACALAVLILVRHYKNIQRMLAGTEPRAGRRNA